MNSDDLGCRPTFWWTTTVTLSFAMLGWLVSSWTQAQILMSPIDLLLQHAGVVQKLWGEEEDLGKATYGLGHASG
jgi:hypothetical protein